MFDCQAIPVTIFLWIPIKRDDVYNCINRAFRSYKTVVRGCEMYFKQPESMKSQPLTYRQMGNGHVNGPQCVVQRPDHRQYHQQIDHKEEQQRHNLDAPSLHPIQSHHQIHNQQNIQNNQQLQLLQHRQQHQTNHHQQQQHPRDSSLLDSSSSGQSLVNSITDRAVGLTWPERNPRIDSDPRNRLRTSNVDSRHDVACVVCGDKSSGKHYGQYTCEGCKSFFKRSIRRNLTYTCRGNDDCRVDQHQRNQCQSCRLTKCLNKGMKRDSVQRGRVPVTLSQHRSIQNVPTCSLLSIQNGTPDDITTAINNPVTLVHASYSNVQSHSHLVNQTHNACTHGNYERSKLASHGFNSNGNNWTRCLYPDDGQTNCCFNPPTSFIGQPLSTIYENAARIMFRLVEWAQSIPPFAELPVKDQLALLDNSWNQLFLIKVVQVGINDEVSGIIYSTASNDIVQRNKLQLLAYWTKRITNQIARLQEMRLDAVEFSYLKALALFSSEVVSDERQCLVNRAQDESACGLREHHARNYPADANRFANLLTRLPSLKNVRPDILHCLFLSRLIGPTPASLIIRDILLLNIVPTTSGSGRDLTTTQEKQQNDSTTSMLS